jgi:hypothetical protein
VTIFLLVHLINCLTLLQQNRKSIFFAIVTKPAGFMTD